MKKTIIALSLLVSTFCVAQELDLPTWFTRYKQLRHHAEHFKDRYDVMTLRLLFAVERCDTGECLKAAHETWIPATDHIAKAYVYAKQMEDIVVKFCVDESSMPYCVTMLRTDMKYGKHRGYKGFIIKHMLVARKLVEAHKELKETPLGESKGTDI